MKVLIVDDSIFSQRMTANLIKKYISDVELYYAVDGQDGYNKYKNVNPDYIVVDLLMPKIGGIELIGMIKEHNEHAKVIVLSADVQKNVREEVDALNIIDFVNKPFCDEKAKPMCEMMIRSLS